MEFKRTFKNSRIQRGRLERRNKKDFYEGLPFFGKKTEVFAYLGIPESKGKLPAMVLVHGGGGTAFSEWVKIWNRRGYAAISMDLCGCIPERENGKWKRHKNGGPPGWSECFSQIDWEIYNQWPFHAIADIILANSLLHSFPEIDKDKIGITGISWGGYLTCIASGIDNRFKFAITVYGCGFLMETMFFENLNSMEKEKRKKMAGTVVLIKLSRQYLHSNVMDKWNK